MQWTSATNWLGRTVMVTGASGFLGGAVARLLLELGAQVHGTGCCRLPGEGVIAHRMRLPDEVEPVFAAVKPEVIFHLASPVDLARDPALYTRLREGVLDGSAAVAAMALRLGARLVQVGTCEEYGAAEAPFSETLAPAPVSPYSALKAAATDWALMLHRTVGLKVGVVRPFRGYGPGDQSSVISAAARAALLKRPFEMTDGAMVREWNHVDALAEGIVAAGAHPDAVGRVVNIGGGPRVSVIDVVRRVFRLAGADEELIRVGALPRRSGEIERFWGDHSLARSLWGEITQPELDEGLSDTLDWLASEADL